MRLGLLSPLCKQKAGFQRHSKSCPRSGNLRSRIRVKFRCVQCQCYTAARRSIFSLSIGYYIFLSRFVQGCHKDTSRDGYHRSNRYFISHRSGGWQTKVKALANLRTGEDVSFLAYGRGLLSVYLCDKGTNQLILQH